jgi:hypothetical protein
MLDERAGIAGRRCRGGCRAGCGGGVPQLEREAWACRLPRGVPREPFRLLAPPMGRDAGPDTSNMLPSKVTV